MINMGDDVVRILESHTLPIKDCHVLESFTVYRGASGSLDRNAVIYDVHQATVVLRATKWSRPSMGYEN
jgi:hypothetical protein